MTMHSDHRPPAGTRDVERWRRRIDIIDRKLLHLLNERAACAREIGEIKRAMHLPVLVPSREKDVVRKAVAANPGPLGAAAVRRIVRRIIDECRGLEGNGQGKKKRQGRP